MPTRSGGLGRPASLAPRTHFESQRLKIMLSIRERRAKGAQRRAAKQTKRSKGLLLAREIVFQCEEMKGAPSVTIINSNETNENTFRFARSPPPHLVFHTDWHCSLGSRIFKVIERTAAATARDAKLLLCLAAGPLSNISIARREKLGLIKY